MNEATVSSPTPDPAPGNNTNGAEVPLFAPAAALTVTKANGVTSVVAGTQTTYTITVTNGGPSDVSGVTVRDPLPAGVASASWTCTATGGGSCAAASGNGGIDTTVSLPVNAVATFSFVATVAPDAAGSTLVNTVTAQNPPGFSDTTPVSATDTDTLTHSADVSISKAGPASVVPGNNAVYTVVVTNHGPSTANNVVVNDSTPGGLTFVSNTGDCTTAFPCALGTLAPGDSRTITTTFTVPLGYTTPNPIAQTASVASSTTDPTPGNNTATVQTSVNTDADVAVTKSVAPTSALVGDTVTAVITATNNGPNQASGVVVTDELPAGLAFVSASASQGSYAPGTGQWSVGTLSSGQSATLTLTAQVTQAGTLTNIATKTFANEPDPDTSNDSTEGTLNTAAAADVGIQKVVDNATPAVGENVTFTVTATNHGPSDATGVVVTDALPAGLTLVSATPSPPTTYDPASGEWTVGALANDASATLTLVATVTTSGMLVNTAEKTAQTEADPNPANDRKSVSLNATTMADIQVAKAVSNETPAVGEQVTFTVTATNAGPSPATGVEVTDVLPAGLSFVSATPSQGSYASGTGVWTVGTLAATQSAVLSLTALVDETGTLTNTAEKTASDVEDPNPDNNSGSATVTADRVADLSITKTSGLTTVMAGEPITYTITVTNAGPTAVVGAGVSDPFPAALTGVTWTCTPGVGGSCGAAGGTGDILATVDLAAGASVTFSATGTVLANATGTLSNTASVAPPADTTDPVADNNSATDTTAIETSADVRIAKSGPANVTAGSTVAFTITVTNPGPSDATAVVVDDQTPAGLSFVSNTGSCTTAFPCDLGTLPMGATRTITTTYAVPSSYTAPNPIVNTATVASATPDPVPDNNTGTATVNLNAPVAALAVTKTNGVTSVEAGTQTTYTITVTNAGPSDATAVIVRDPLPTTLGSAMWTCTASGGGSCAVASGTGPIDTTVSLPVNAVATFSLKATVAPDAMGQVVNTVTAENPPGFGDPRSASATDTDTITHSADVSITKTGPAVVVPGNTVEYTIVVSNSGPSAATDVAVSDATPQGLLFQMNAGACTTPFPCALGTLMPGDSRTITATFLVSVDYPMPMMPPPIMETATVSSPTPDPVPGNNTATAQTTVDTRADVSVTKSVTPSDALVGDTVTFTVQAANAGPSTASGVVVTDMLPAGLALVTATPSQGSYTEATGDWLVGSLDAGDVATLVLKATVNQPGTLINIAVKTAADQPDPDTSNDTAGAQLNAAPAADVAIQKTADNETPSVGEQVTFTVTATNRGPSDATGVVVEDKLPAGLGLVSATASQGSYDPADGSWTVGDLAVGVSASLTLVATVDATGALVNTARKTAQTEADPNPLNDQSSVTVNAGTSADVEVKKAASTSTPAVGEQVTFTVAVLNRGPSPATGVEVTDVLPPGLEFVSATASQGTYDSTNGLWTVGALPATNTQTLSLTALVTQAGDLTNTATKTHSDVTDPNPANDSGSATVTAGSRADLSITKSDGHTTAFPGQTLTYTITVENAGPSPVTGATVSDVLPTVLQGVTWTCTASAGGSCGAPAGTGSILTTVDLPAGGVATFSLTGTVAPMPPVSS